MSERSNSFGIIYYALNTLNDKMYIGQTIYPLKSRIRRHYRGINEHPDLYFMKALKKYEKEAFTWGILENNICFDALNDKEKFWIGFYRTNCKRIYNEEQSTGYNLTDGGTNLIGDNNPFFGKHHSEQTKLKWKTSRKGTQMGSKNNFFGKKQKQHVIDKVVLSRQLNKKFICIHNDIILGEWVNINQASRDIGISANAISKSLTKNKSTFKGKYNYQDKYYFKFVQGYDNDSTSI